MDVDRYGRILFGLPRQVGGSNGTSEIENEYEKRGCNPKTRPTTSSRRNGFDPPSLKKKLFLKTNFKKPNGAPTLVESWSRWFSCFRLLRFAPYTRVKRPVARSAEQIARAGRYPCYRRENSLRTGRKRVFLNDDLGQQTRTAEWVGYMPDRTLEAEVRQLCVETKMLLLFFLNTLILKNEKKYFILFVSQCYILLYSYCYSCYY